MDVVVVSFCVLFLLQNCKRGHHRWLLCYIEIIIITSSAVMPPNLFAFKSERVHVLWEMTVMQC